MELDTAAQLERVGEAIGAHHIALCEHWNDLCDRAWLKANKGLDDLLNDVRRVAVVHQRSVGSYDVAW